MRAPVLLTTVLALCATTAWAQNAPAAAAATPAPAAPLQLEVALRGYAAGDRVGRTSAGDSAIDRLDGYAWADRTLCAVGSGTSAPASNTPWIGWHFSGAVQGTVSEGGRNAVVFRVEWQRVWENGARVAEGVKGTQSSSLREGERLELDRVNAADGAVGGCGASNVRLEVGVVARPAYRMAVANQARDMLAGAQAAGRGGAGSVAAAPTTGDFAKRFKEYDSALQGFLKQPGSYDAELWLVHRRPDGTETTEQMQKVRFTGSDVAFNFPAVVVTTSKGDLTLDFTGTLRAGVGPDAKSFPSLYARGLNVNPLADAQSRAFFLFNSADGTPIRNAMVDGTNADNAVRIAVTIARRVRGGSPAIDSRGGSYFFMDVPAPTDVVSFEFPSLPNVTPDLLKGHTFSLRIRVTPVAK